MAFKVFRGPTVPKLVSIELVTASYPPPMDSFAAVYRDAIGPGPRPSTFEAHYVERYRPVVLPFNWTIFILRVVVIGAVGAACGWTRSLWHRRKRVRFS